jgi:NAD(P)-dependent dehydrogenase (short-subunit alcohol dehydrogenase family)
MSDTKKVLITGASGGLGAALTQVYHGHGWSVVGVDKGPNVSSDHDYIQCDFTEKAQIQNLCQQLKQRYPIHTLICNAAYYHFSAIETICDKQLMDSWMINLVAHFQLLQTLTKEQSGIQQVVIIGSDQCFEAMDFNIAYAMSKAALIQMVKSFAAECRAPHIMAVSPGTLKDTPITLEAAEGLSKINGLSVEDTLKSFDEESPTGHCIDPIDLAEWIFDGEGCSKFPSGHVEFLPTL